MSESHVFISYAREDRDFVDELARRLKGAGLQVWYDQELRPGRPWSAALEEAIRAAHACIVVLTPNSTNSGYVRKEIHFAQEQAQIPVIPLMLRDCQPPLPLSDLQWVDFREGRDGLEELLAALRQEPRPTVAPMVLPPAPEPLELAVRLAQSDPDELITFFLRCDDLGIDAGPFPFTSPLGDEALTDLRWYLENYPRWPAGPTVDRAARIEARMEDWGRDLFHALFSEAEAVRNWQQFRDQTDRPRLLTLDATDYQILRLPWELLADEEGHLFALGIPIRRRLHKVQAARPRTFDLPVRVLMVIARPQDENVAFIDPRASAQALLDATEPLGRENVIVEFLHPPTLKALTDRLRPSAGRVVSLSNGSGQVRDQPPVHVVHFDGHGVYSTEKGLGYLLFEDADGGCDRVDADRLGTLLTRAQVPLMVLGACQSAHADAPDPYSSVAARLIRAGVGSVVAMQYSVLVETRRRFMAAFYRALAQGRTIGQALDEGRYDLLADTFRLKLYRPDGSERPLHLRDWFLPALYQQRADPAPFAGAVLQPTEAAERELALYGDFLTPRYGFVGRTEELWHLERLFFERRVVVLHGFGGQGKTALASEAARWLTRKGRFGRALFLSFERGGEADWAVAQMGRLLCGDDFASLGRDQRLPTLRKALAEAPTLIVWDNFESVLPQGSAELPPDALRELLDLGADLAFTGQGRLLVTTRVQEIHHDAFRPSQTAARQELGGLGRWEALELAGAVLDALGHDRPPRRDLQRLLRFLGGHPLSIQLVVPNLKDYADVAAVIERFEELYPGFIEGKARERNESLEVSLSFSLRRLSDEVRERLPALGVFAGGALEPALLPVTGLKPSEWAEVREELVRAGLATVGIESPIGTEIEGERFRGHYIHFHPTLAPHLRHRLSDDQREELEARYRQVYYQLSGYLYQTDPRSPHQARAVALRELPNLRRALDLTLDAGDAATAVAFADNVEHFLKYFGRWREREALVKRISESASQREEGPLTKAAYRLETRRGELLLDQGRARQAEQVFRRLLARMDTPSPPLPAGEERGPGGEVGAYDRALTLGRLGRSLKHQGRPADAEGEFRRALEVLSGLDQENESVRRQTGTVHTDLADVLRDQGRYPEAREQYEAALEIDQEVGGDPRGTAVTLGQLGTLALREGDYVEARRRYRDALKRFRDLGETRSEAILWHQLGMAAQEAAGRAAGAQRAALLEEAEAAYQESLRLEETLGNQAGAAQSAGQLASVAQLAGRPADAERWYRRAIELGEKLGDRQGLAKRYNNLAGLLLNAHRLPAGERPQEFAGRDLLAEAEELADKARELKEQIGDLSLEPWTTYSILADIAQARGDGEVARDWRRKERAAYVAFPGHWARYRERWAPRVAAIRAAVQGDETAKEAVHRLLEHLSQTDDWRNLAAALRRVLDGARDADALAEELDLSRKSYLIVVKTLEAVEAPQPPAGSEPAGGLNGRLEPAHPAVRALAPLVGAVVVVCQGNEAVRPQVEEALDGLAGQADWRGLAGALRRLLDGERERDALAAGLDEVDAALLDLALGALAGDQAAQARLENLAREAQQQAQAGLTQEINRAFQAWLQTPAGQAALREVQSQGLAREEAMQCLLTRFMEEVR